MKMLTGLMCLLLVSGVGCGQQSETSSASAPKDTPSTAPSVPTAAQPTPKTQSAPAQAAAPDESDGLAPGEALDDVEEKSSADTANTRLAAAMTTPTAPPSSRWQKGVNYQEIVPAQPTNSPPEKIEVLEVFWYGCPHCYALDPYIKNWEKKRPTYIDFKQLPVIWGPAHSAHARLFYTIEALGKPELHQAVLREYHVAHNPLTSQNPAEAEQMAVQFAKRQGIDAETFRKAYHSFQVETQLQRAQELTRRYLVETVPMIIINGKYRADVTSAGGQSQLLALIDDLAASEHRKH